MMFSMLDLLALNFITALAALLAAAALRIRPLRFMPMAALLIHVVMIQLIVLLTGLAGRMDIVTWRVVGLSLFILCIAGSTVPAIAAELNIYKRRIRRTARAIGPLRLIPALLLLLGMAAVIAVLGTLVGPYLPDVTTYHLAPPTDWIVNARVADHNWPDPRSWWPMGHSLLAAWWMLPTRSLNFSVLANLHWVAMAVAVCWTWARQMGCRPRIALLASCLVATLPVLWAQAVSGLNDMAIATLILGTIAPLMTRRVSAMHFVLSACFLLTALGIKATLLPMAPPLLALGAFRFFRRETALCGPGAVIAVRWYVLLLMCATLGGFWYLRDAHVWGNPLYPATVNVGPIHLKGDRDIADKVGRLNVNHLVVNLKDLLTHRMWDDRKSVVRADVKYGSGFGVVAAGLGGVALLFMLWRAPGSRAALITVLGIALFLAAAVEHDDWFGRFFAFLAMVMVICAAAMVPRLAENQRKIWLAMIALAAMPSIYAGLCTTAPPVIRNYWQEAGLERVPLTATAAFTEHSWLYTAIEQLPDEKPVVIFAPTHSGPVAAMHGPTLRRHLFYTDQPPTLEEIRGWKEAGAKWLIVSVKPTDLKEAEEMLPLGLRRVDRGVYEIP